MIVIGVKILIYGDYSIEEIKEMIHIMNFVEIIMIVALKL